MPATAEENFECSYTVVTSTAEVRLSDGRIGFADDRSATPAGLYDISGRCFKMILPPGTEIERLECRTTNPVVISRNVLVRAVPPDIKTGAIDPSARTRFPEYAAADSALAILVGSGYWENIHVADVAAYPLRYTASGDLILFPEIELRFVLRQRDAHPAADGNTNILAYNTLREIAANGSQIAELGYMPSDENIIAGFPRPELLLITSRSLEPSFHPYLLWKNQKGVRSSVILIEDVLASSPGGDPAEQLRNYLIEAHNGGVRWIILGGDEDNIPIRYLFAGNAGDTPPPLSMQQLSDLYYSDLTGDWDSDGDGVWGESVHDRPDIYPEIYVGRVPARDTIQVINWVANALTYEKNPGSGDPAYLTRALISCADEMRDLNQHDSIAGLLPENISCDMVRLIEEPNGSSEAPTQPWGASVIDVMNEGWGFISSLNHGDLAFFVSQSSGNNSYNLSEVWGDTINYEHDGSMSHLTTEDQPGVFYAVGCDEAAFDFDKGIFNPGPWITTRSLAESYLFQPGGGTAFLGNTRWGWVGSSFRLENYFLRRAFNDSTGHLGMAEALSKVDYPTYYDIIYGHNLFGDPETEIWRGISGRLHIDGPRKALHNREQTLRFRIWDKSGPIPDSRLCLYLEPDVFEIGYSDISGNVELTINPGQSGLMTATATKSGYVADQYEIVVGTPTDARDTNAIPGAYNLYQNCPNPFNSSTAITFELGYRSPVQIEIFDLCGRRIRTLTSGQHDAGRYQVIWDGTNDQGESAASGVYFYRLDIGNSPVRQMTLVR